MTSQAEPWILLLEIPQGKCFYKLFVLHNDSIVIVKSFNHELRPQSHLTLFILLNWLISKCLYVMTLIEQRCYESQCRYAHNKQYVIQHGRDFPDLKASGCQQCEVDRTGETSHQERIRNLTYFPFLLHSIAFLLEQKSSLTYEEVRGNDVGTSHFKARSSFCHRVEKNTKNNQNKMDLDTCAFTPWAMVTGATGALRPLKVLSSHDTLTSKIRP